MLTGAALFCAAPPAQSQGTDPWTQVRAEAIRAHVQFLSDDLLEGRAAGSRGFDTAAAYVVAQFRQLGLKPGGEGDSYLQAVPLLEATAVLPGSAAQLVRDDGTVKFSYGNDYLPGADYFAANSALTAPLVFAGFGIEAPELSYNDLDQLDLNGRIVVVFDGAPERFAHNERAYYSSTVDKHANLVRRGAIGIVTIDTREGETSFPWEQRVAASWMPQMRWLGADGQPVDAFPELKARFRFSRGAAARLFEGAPMALDKALDVAEAGIAQGFDLPGSMTLSATTGLRRTQSANVIAMLEGSDPLLKREQIVISAHLDHLGRGAPVNGDSIYNGAHDNASGIGILLEMARALVASGERPKRSIVFAAVTAEERGELGSDYFARHPTSARSRIVANLNIDMPLLVGPMLDFVALGAEHSTLGPVARRAATAEGYALSPDSMPEAVSFIRSDQFSFVRQGIPSLYVIGGYKSRFRDTDVDALAGEFLKNHYHQPSDDVSLPLHYPTAAAFTRMHVRMAMELADAQARPRWNRRDFFAEKFGQPRP
jgi:Zn-dependent M28 family amino/carboxypeptidase